MASAKKTNLTSSIHYGILHPLQYQNINQYSRTAISMADRFQVPLADAVNC